jgi:spore maturation protein CgeB
MTELNFVYAETYPDSLEQYIQRALQDYVKKRPQDTLVLNGTDGDVILDIKCRFVERVQKMKGIKVLYFPDNLDRFGDLFETCEQHYDFIFFAHRNDKIDNTRYFHLPLAYDPYIHFPLDQKKTIDVAFVGTKHKDRAHIAKIPGIKIYGNEWGDGIYPVYSAKKRKIYAQTRIIVNHHVEGDTSPNMRTFECLAMGTFMVSDLVPKALEGGMVKYDSFEDLLVKIEYYLEHEAERKAIAEKGKERVRLHTYEKRLEEMIEVIENARLG